jgi:shikimate dehydrogenase
MVLAGVLGFPVRHSRSPAMMNAAFAELGLDWRYLALPVPPALFAETVRSLPGSGYRGANVTIPHKLAAHELADELTPAAAAIGAANTLVFEDGRILADNTDAGGLLDALGEPVPATALVLGAGGAGRAAAWALKDAGAEVAVWNRTPERAAALAEELGVRAVERPEPVALLVNATSVGLVRADPPGRLGAATPVGLAPPDPGGLLEAATPVGLAQPDPAARLPLVDAQVVVDLVYGAEPTPVARWAAGRGARVVDGLEVLVRQGARSLERWTGRPAPLEVMRRAAAGDEAIRPPPSSASVQP